MKPYFILVLSAVIAFGNIQDITAQVRRRGGSSSGTNTTSAATSASSARQPQTSPDRTHAPQTSGLLPEDPRCGEWSFIRNAQGPITGVKSEKNAEGTVLYGFVNSAGSWVILPIFDEAYWNPECRLGIIGRDTDGGIFRINKIKLPEYWCEGLVDENGRILLPPDYYYSVMLTPNATDKRKYVFNRWSDEDGEHCGLYNLITQKGILISPANAEVNIPYKIASIYEGEGEELPKDLLLVGTLNEEETWMPKIYNMASDTWVFDFPVCDEELRIFPNSIVYSPKEGLIGMYSYDGSVILPREYELLDRPAASDESDVLIAVKDGRCGLYTTSGEELVPLKYQWLELQGKVIKVINPDGSTELIPNPLIAGNDVRIGATQSFVSKKEPKSTVAVSRYPAPDSDVDRDIPRYAADKDGELFAFIIANENY